MSASSAPVCFMHINKAGGTSFSALAQEAFAPQEVCPAGLVRELLALPRAGIDRFRYFRGHFGTGIIGLLDRQPRLFTLLRDPVDRMISQFNAHRSNAGTDLHARIESYGGDLERCLEDPWLRSALGDYQTRFLGCPVDLRPMMADPSLPRPGIQKILADMAPTLDMDAVLVQALDRLRSMETFGLLERFEESAARLAAMLGLTLEGPLPRLNVSGENARYGSDRRLGRSDFSPRALDRIRAANQHDLRLYEQAVALFEAPGR
ncbi:MAG TPA: recombinase family protein [Azospirillum sp.]|nr:recombinase family protein [Azospirillum sp.]